MRNRKAFFSAAIGAAVLVAGTVAQAADPPSPPPPPPTSCSPTGTQYEFTVFSGPSIVACGETAPCACNGDPGALCTQIEYQVFDGEGSYTGSVLALEGKGVLSVDPAPEGSQIFAPCAGDDSFGFGFGSCHEQAVSTFLPGSVNGKFTITLAGERRAGPTTLAVPGEELLLCEILGIGLDNVPNPDQIKQTTERVDFKGCVVEFTRDPVSGDVLSARLISPGPSCTSPFLADDGTLKPQPVTGLELTLQDGTPLGTPLGTGKFGDGYISTGSDSCTTRVIGGKVYTWGTPCPSP